jgi:glutathione synthase/RimK-type ligase-like ATP-grasp enzyme
VTRLGGQALLLANDALEQHRPVSSWQGDVTMDGCFVMDCQAVYVRAIPSPHPPVIPEGDKLMLHHTWYTKFMQARERSGFFLALLLSLEHAGIRVVNPPQAGAALQHKPFQLDVLRRLGADLPRTLISNDPERIRAFHASESAQNEEVIFKPLLGGAITRVLDAAALGRLERVRQAPVIFQQRIRGDDIRVILVGDRVVSAVAIRTPVPHLDFRADPIYSGGHACYERVVLPPRVEAICKGAARACGLPFTGIDIKHTAEDGWFFLELNSSPTYMDVERKTGDPISRALAQFLLGISDAPQPNGM